MRSKYNCYKTEENITSARRNELNKRVYSSSERLKALHKTYNQNLPSQKNMSCGTDCNNSNTNDCECFADKNGNSPTLKGGYSKPINKTRYALNSHRRIDNDCNKLCNYPNIESMSTASARTFALSQIHNTVKEETNISKKKKVINPRGMWYSKCSVSNCNAPICPDKK